MRGRVFVADKYHHRIQWMAITALSSPTPTWSEFGFVADRGGPARLNSPEGLAVDPDGNVFATDGSGGPVRLYRWSGTAYVLDTGFASATPHVVDGIPIAAPTDLAVAGSGAVYLLDSRNDRVLVADNASATSWRTWRADPAWGNPTGLDVSADGATVYLASPNLHQVLVVPRVGAVRRLGGYGTYAGRFRAPHDVALLADGRLLVADTQNHRVQLVHAEDRHDAYDSTLGVAPLFGAPVRLAQAGGRVFVTDTDSQQLIAFLGPGAPQPFDVYLRDWGGDDGTVPSLRAGPSPDVLVRHQPDVTAEGVERLGLEAFAVESPIYDQNNYVYLAVHNGGSQTASGVIAELFWADSASDLIFPADWRTDGFFLEYSSPTLQVAGNTLEVPPVGPSSGSGAGLALAGRSFSGHPLPGPAIRAGGSISWHGCITRRIPRPCARGTIRCAPATTSPDAAASSSAGPWVSAGRTCWWCGSTTRASLSPATRRPWRRA